MGWRYRRRIKIFPGFYINISKSGIGANVGVKGASVTFGPKGTYVNTGLSGTGLYRRDRVNSGKENPRYVDSPIDSYPISSEVNTSISSKHAAVMEDAELLHKVYRVEDNGDWRFLAFKSRYYILYFISLLMPFLCFALYGFANWWMFFSCLLTDFVQLLCWSFVYFSTFSVENACYKVKTTNNVGTLNHEKNGHRFRMVLSSVLVIENLIPFLATSDSFIKSYNDSVGIVAPYFYNEPYDFGVITFVMTLIMIICWIITIIQEYEFVTLIRQLELDFFSRNEKKNDEVKIEKQEHVIQSSQNINDCEFVERKKSVSQDEDTLTRDILGNLKNKEIGKPLSSISKQEFREMLKNNIGADGCNESSNITRQKVKEILGSLIESNNNSISLTYNPKVPLVSYKYPTFDLLKKCKKNSPNEEELQDNKIRLVQLLGGFGIIIASIKATVGPVFTLYEMTFRQGVSSSKIKGLEDDIAMTLRAQKVRILSPSEKRPTIGLEVLNREIHIVSIESVLNSPKFKESSFALPCAIGKTVYGELFMFDMTKTPHILVAGSTGQGKSSFLNTIITSILYKKHPSEVKFVLMDSVGIEFGLYAHINKHFLAVAPNAEDIISKPKDVAQTLKSLCIEMNDRLCLIADAGERRIDGYNSSFVSRLLNPERGHRYLPYLIIIMDSYSELISGYEEEIVKCLEKLTKHGAIAGIHLIISTELPSNEIIPASIKKNMPTRISFRVPERIDSQMIIDCDGAEELLGNGDMLFKDNRQVTRVQCAYISTQETKAVIDYIGGQSSYEGVFELPDSLCDEYYEYSNYDNSEDLVSLDELFAEAARVIFATQQGSSSLIQRKFSIGYNRAERLMDQLEKAGVVGAAHGSKPREVLIQDENTLQSLLNTLGLD